MPVIHVQAVEGRYLARVEPNGPEAVAEEAEVALEFAKKAHQAYLRSYADWIPEAVIEKESHYHVEWLLGG